MIEPIHHKTVVRNTRRSDFDAIIAMTKKVYRHSPPWRIDQLESHLKVFPKGQFVATDAQTGQVIGMAASLIIRWADYGIGGSWRDFTSRGMFTNHDPKGRTLYGAEVMVHPNAQRNGVGTRLYEARRELVERLGLLRIRAGARLRHYHRYSGRMSAEEYVIKVIQGELRDPTLSFQLRHRFRVVAVVSNYLKKDPSSLGYAAVIEWINHNVAKPEDYAGRDPRYRRPSSQTKRQ